MNLKLLLNRNLPKTKIHIFLLLYSFFIYNFQKIRGDKILSNFFFRLGFITLYQTHLNLSVVNIVTLVGINGRRLTRNRKFVLWFKCLLLCICLIFCGFILVVLNSVIWAACCTLVLTVVSLSSLPFVKRNCFHSEMKGFPFPSCCPGLQPLQQKRLSLNTE